MMMNTTRTLNLRVPLAVMLALTLLSAPGLAFGQQADKPHIVFVVGEVEYGSAETMPAFAKELEDRFDVRVTMIMSEMGGVEHERVPGIEIPEYSAFDNLEVILEADLMVLFIRFRIPPPAQFEIFQQYFDSGKPAVALRTTSHGFWKNKGWFPVFFGGHYKTHASNADGTHSLVMPTMQNHPIMRGVARSQHLGEGGVYNAQPLSDTATPLLLGKTGDLPGEPIAWVNKYRPESRIFYTSLGSKENFGETAFRTMLYNAIFWALDHEVPPGGMLDPDGAGIPVHGIAKTPPPPNREAPQGATVLFDGSDLTQWKHWDPSVDPKAIGIDTRADSSSGGPVFVDARWPVQGDVTVAQPGYGDILTKEDYGNYRLHLDFLVPDDPEYVQGKFRGASGVYLSGLYEVAILDSYGQPADTRSSGSIYDVSAPSENAAKAAGSWQSMDIEYRHLIGETANVSVWLNDTQVQDNVAVADRTLYGFRPNRSGKPLYAASPEDTDRLYKMGEENDYTLAARIQTTESRGTIVTRRPVQGRRRSAKSLRIAGGKAAFYGGQRRSVDSDVVINDGEPHHVALTHSAGVVKIYVDGKLAATEKDFGSPDGENQVLHIGDARRGLTEDKKDNFHVVEFHNRALKAKEVRLLAAGKSAGASDPVLRWQPEPDVIDPNADLVFRGPIRLQADSSNVQFANIWLQPLDE